MDEKMMSKTQQRVIKLITKPHPARSNHEIDIVLPWLKKKSDVMKNIEDRKFCDVMKYIEDRKCCDVMKNIEDRKCCDVMKDIIDPKCYESGQEERR